MSDSPEQLAEKILAICRRTVNFKGLPLIVKEITARDAELRAETLVAELPPLKLSKEVRAELRRVVLLIPGDNEIVKQNALDLLDTCDQLESLVEKLEEIRHDS